MSRLADVPPRPLDGTLADHTQSRFEAHTALPAGATDSGWSRDGQQVWMAADGSAAYFDVGEELERWPWVSGEGPMCA